MLCLLSSKCLFSWFSYCVFYCSCCDKKELFSSFEDRSDEFDILLLIVAYSLSFSDERAKMVLFIDSISYFWA